MHRVLAIGADHRGYAYKEKLKKIEKFGNCSVKWIDIGAKTAERSDYPVYAQAAVQEIFKGNVQGAVLICGSGVGMAIAANRFPGIYAAVVWEPIVARMAKEDDNANVLSLSADYVSFNSTVQCIEEWVSATFKQGHYAYRLSLIDPVK